MSSMQPLSDHERVRRELWAAVYRQAHDATLTGPTGRVEPEFRWAEAADRALSQFDRRFGTDGVSELRHQEPSPSQSGERRTGVGG